MPEENMGKELVPHGNPDWPDSRTAKGPSSRTIVESTGAPREKTPPPKAGPAPEPDEYYEKYIKPEVERMQREKAAKETAHPVSSQPEPQVGLGEVILTTAAAEGVDTLQKLVDRQPEDPRRQADSESVSPPPEEPEPAPKGESSEAKTERRIPSYEKEGWRVLRGELELAAAGNLDPKSQEAKDLIHRKNELLQAAIRDGVLAAYDDTAEKINSVITSGNPDEIKTRWGEIAIVVSGLNPTKLEMSRFRDISPDPDIQRRLGEVYGGLWGDVQDTLSREMTIYHDRSTGADTSRDTLKQLYLGFSSLVPSNLRDIGRRYVGVIQKEVADANRMTEQARIQIEKDKIPKELAEALAASRGPYDYRVERENAVVFDHSVFGPDFVTMHGLPQQIFEPPRELGQKMIRGTDTATLLGQIFKSGEVMPILSWENIAYTIRGMGLDPAVQDQMIIDTFYRFNELRNGMIPLMIARYKTNDGSFASISGREGAGGVLNKGQGSINLKEVIPTFRNDVLAKRALGILLAADGYTVGEILPEDLHLAQQLRVRFRQIIEVPTTSDARLIEKLQKELGGGIEVSRIMPDEKTGWNVYKVRKSEGWAQNDMVKYMDVDVGGQIATHLGCDIGRVDMMVMFYTVLGGGQRSVDYRELYQRFPILREAYPCVLDEREPVGKQVKGDVLMAPLLRKLKVGDGEYGFGFIERELKLRGIGGMFDALLMLKDGNDLWKYWSSWGAISDAMKKVEDIQLGKDSFENINQRRLEIAKILDPFTAGDPPQIRLKTLEAIKSMPVYAGKGRPTEAELIDKLVRGVPGVAEALGLARQANKLAGVGSVLRKTPQELLGDFIRSRRRRP